jgi:hypothetical protein
LNAPGDLAGPYDFVIANFGALNCVTDLSEFAARLRKGVISGGVVALVTMGCFCAWETLWYGLRFDRRAFRRWRGSATGVVGDRRFPVRYWSTHEIATAFRRDFQVEAVCGIGLFLPPSYVFSFVQRRPLLLKTLWRLERRNASSRRLAWLADHQLVVLRRNAAEGLRP